MLKWPFVHCPPGGWGSLVGGAGTARHPVLISAAVRIQMGSAGSGGCGFSGAGIKGEHPAMYGLALAGPAAPH